MRKATGEDDGSAWVCHANANLAALGIPLRKRGKKRLELFCRQKCVRPTETRRREAELGRTDTGRRHGSYTKFAGDSSTEKIQSDHQTTLEANCDWRVTATNHLWRALRSTRSLPPPPPRITTTTTGITTTTTIEIITT